MNKSWTELERKVLRNSLVWQWQPKVPRGWTWGTAWLLWTGSLSSALYGQAGWRHPLSHTESWRLQQENLHQVLLTLQPDWTPLRPRPTCIRMLSLHILMLPLLHSQLTVHPRGEWLWMRYTPGYPATSLITEMLVQDGRCVYVCVCVLNLLVLRCSD